MLIEFDVQGQPMAQPRVKARNAGGFIKIYTPSIADKWKAAVGETAKASIMEPIKEPCFVSLDFRFTRPKCHFGTGKNSTRLKPAAPMIHSQKPDIDNLVKAVLDGMVKFGALKDDDIVVGTLAIKGWEGDKGPGVSVSITSWAEIAHAISRINPQPVELFSLGLSCQPSIVSMANLGTVSQLQGSGLG